MTSTYSPNLAIQLIGTGDQAGQWGNSTDTNLGTLIESAISGYVTQTFADADITLPMPLGADGGTGTPASPVTARNMFINCVGTNTAQRNLILPINKKIYFINNATTGGFALNVTTGGAGITVPNGCISVLVCNGTQITNTFNYIPVLQGGTVVNSTPGTVSWTINGASGQYAQKLQGLNSAGASFGANYLAGTTAADICAIFASATGTPYLTIRGDGSIAAAGNTQQGVGTINATGLYINGVSVLTSVVNISGNAGTATALQTSRTINGVGFNGTANITIGVAAANVTGAINLQGQVTGLLPVANANGNLYRGVLGSGNITVQSGGSPSGGSPGDIFLIY